MNASCKSQTLNLGHPHNQCVIIKLVRAFHFKNHIVRHINHGVIVLQVNRPFASQLTVEYKCLSGMWQECCKE